MNDNLNVDDVGKGFMAIVVRIFGFILLLAGLWIAFEVLFEAWGLYQEPQKIERFARAIEEGSNIDKSLVSIRESVTTESAETFSEEDGGSPGTIGTYEDKPAPAKSGGANVRVSYFLAWIIVPLLMLLIARIALGIIKTGGELVLYDMQIKQFAKMLVRESSRARD